MHEAGDGVDRREGGRRWCRRCGAWRARRPARARAGRRAGSTWPDSSTCRAASAGTCIRTVRSTSASACAAAERHLEGHRRAAAGGGPRAPRPPTPIEPVGDGDRHGQRRRGAAGDAGADQGLEQRRRRGPPARTTAPEQLGEPRLGVHLARLRRRRRRRRCPAGRWRRRRAARRAAPAGRRRRPRSAGAGGGGPAGPTGSGSGPARALTAAAPARTRSTRRRRRRWPGRPRPARAGGRCRP